MSRRLIGLLAVLILGLLLSGSVLAQLHDTSLRRGSLERPITLWPIEDDDESDDDEGDGGGGLGFGKKIAGTWLGSGTFSVDIGCDGTFDVGPIPFNDAQMFGVGGSRVVTNPANPNSGLGTWTKTGPYQASGRDVNFGVDATPGGTLLNIAIVSIVVDFDESFETATTTFGAEVYLPTQDPLDPTEMPIACSSGSHDSFRKVSALE